MVCSKFTVKFPDGQLPPAGSRSVLSLNISCLDQDQKEEHNMFETSRLTVCEGNAFAITERCMDVERNGADEPLEW